MLVASGVSYRKMDAPGFAELTGAGIYYGAALTEARSCADQHVVVIGGANSAGQAAVYFSGYAGRVSMLVRGDSLAKSMSHYLIEQIAALANVEVRTRHAGGRARTARTAGWRASRSAAPTARSRRRRPTRVSSSSAPRRTPTGSTACSRATPPASSSPGPMCAITAGRWSREPYPLETSVPGVFVAGDVRSRSIKRVASAVGEGSMAVSLIHEYLASA